jgi:hypothetical protein
MSWIIEAYSDFVVKHPFMVMILAVLLTGLSLYGMGLVTTTETSYSNMLPQSYTEIKALNFVSDEFTASGDTVSIVVEIDPKVQGSDEIRDVRSVQALEYMDVLENKVRTVENVVSVSGMPDVLKTMSGGKMPKSQSEILELTSGMEQDGDSSKLQSDSGQNPFEGMVSKDYSLAVISIHISDLPKDKQSELISDINNIIDEAQKPAGLKVGLTGEIVVSSEVTKLIGPTMEQTSGLSLIGILIIVTVLFMSIRYGLTSLMAIAFGVLWVYGLIGFFGISMTSATSGSLSMIMGVGVDFGIQIVNRFRQELKLAKAEKAMKKTLDAVILPMSITTLAALIGFRAMSLGELTLLADLGNIMALGILTCFLAAVTIIPVVLIFSEKIRSRFIK